MPIPKELEFQQAVYPASCSKGAAVTPDDGRKFTEPYNVQHLQRSQREAVRHRREARRVDSRERINQSAQLDRVSRVCISTIQRLYSMLRSLRFWIETLTPQRRFTRGDRQRVVRVQ